MELDGGMDENEGDAPIFLGDGDAKMAFVVFPGNWAFEILSGGITGGTTLPDRGLLVGLPALAPRPPWSGGLFVLLN